MGRPARDLTRKIFGDWTVIRRDGTAGTNAAWLCQCPAGHTRRIAACKLVRGRHQHCALCQKTRLATIYERDRLMVPIWQAAETINEVGEALELSTSEVLNIAGRLRRHGVALKRMRRTARTAAHYRQLRELAKQHKAD